MISFALFAPVWLITFISANTAAGKMVMVKNANSPRSR
jgi:hypothetical protein